MIKIKNQKGQLLISVFLVIMVLAIMIPALIMWIERESVWAVKSKKSGDAFNLAEAGIQRGVWKLKSSTATWTLAANGVIIPGYNFDTVYTDVPGGQYRIKFSSGPSKWEVTILAEGRSDTPSETRAIQAIYRNQTIPSAILSRGVITWANAFSVHWGPVMSHHNITITDANAAKDYFPRKYSRQVVSCNQPGYARDTNGLNPPNTDNVEWWSAYDVPDLPSLDFAALRSSASSSVAVYLTYDRTETISNNIYDIYRWKPTLATNPPGGVPAMLSSTTINTLNVYGCSKMTNYTGPRWWEETRRLRAAPNTLTVNALSSCNLGGNNHNGQPHFQNPWRHPLNLSRRTWYYDGDVILTGGSGANGCGIYGDIIIRGNCENYCGDNYSYTGEVPAEAWREYTIIHKSGSNVTYDTAAINQYPADNGLRTNRSTFNFGGETWTAGQNPPTAENTDVGLRGFLYIGGNYEIKSAMDIHGAIWIEGTVSRATGSEMTLIFFNESLNHLPSLNVVLVRKRWDEVLPSNIPW